MKKIFYTLLCSAFLFTVAACGEKPAVLTGSVSGISIEELGRLSIFINPGDLYNTFSDEITINPDGTFRFERVYDAPYSGYLYFEKVGMVNIFMCNGTQTEVQITVSDNPETGRKELTPVFSGDNATACEIENNGTYPDYNTLVSAKSFAEFYEYINKFFDGELEKVNATGNKKYISFKSGNIASDRIEYALDYSDYTMNTSEEYSNYLENLKIDLNDFRLINAIRRYVAIKGKELAAANGTDKNVEQLRFIKANSTNQEVINNVAGNRINSNFIFGVTDNIEEYWEEFLKTTTNKKDIEKYQPLYESLQKLTPESYAIDFKLNDINDKEVAFLDIVGKGKFTYVDFWATWCGPCRAETPHMVERIAEFAGKNIDFVSISVDEDVEAWKKMSKEEVKWQSYIVPADAKDDFNAKYHINAIPRFSIFDPDGKIIQIDSFRPSDPDFAAKMAEFGVK